MAPLFYILQLFLLFSGAATDLSADRSALLRLRTAVGGRIMHWNTTQTTPCTWAGVTCEKNRVTILRLPGVSLSGELPAATVGNLTALRTLSLRLNRLTGTLPSDLSQCTDLRNLFLQGNHFSGDIPASLFSLKDLIRLNLAGNDFSGEISNGFGNLVRLRTMYLENNQFSGSLPDLSLKNLEQFNVSNNNLSGLIPASLRSMPESAFAGNTLCGGPLLACVGANAPTSPGFATASPAIAVDAGAKKRKLSGGVIAGIVIGCLAVFLLILLVFVFVCRKKTSKKTSAIDIATIKQREIEEKPIGDSESSGVGNGFSVVAAPAASMESNEKSDGVVTESGKKLVFFRNAARVFDLEDLLRASAEVLGKGTFGTAYKAVLEVGTIVAVKRLKDVTINDKEFKEKIDVVGAMDNEHLVPLRAYYYSNDEKLLVYDYMPMGSLSALLHGNKGAGRTPLNWEIRSGIALGAARGIAYLHSQSPTSSHGNIKSSNILLTKSYDARVSDFGLAHLVGPSSTPNRVAGYRAPEVTDPRKVSQKADVYSFGVLLLELLTGKAPTHALLNEEGVDLPRWVQSIVREEWTSEVFDLELLRYQNVEDEMVQLLQLAIDCSAQYPDKRPTMTEVTRQIEELRRSSVADDHDPDIVENEGPPPS